MGNCGMGYGLWGNGDLSWRYSEIEMWVSSLWSTAAGNEHAAVGEVTITGSEFCSGAQFWVGFHIL